MSDGLKDALRLTKSFNTLMDRWREKKIQMSSDDDDWSGLWDDEKTVRVKSPWFDPAPECECGAKHTTAPNLHLRWCPKYKDPLGKNKK